MLKKRLYYVVFFQWLILFGGGSQNLQAEEFYQHNVRPGETIWGICLALTDRKDCWQKLDKINGVTFPRKLPPAYVLNIPIDWLKAQPVPVTVSMVTGQVFYTPNRKTEKIPLPLNSQLAVNTMVITVDGEALLTFGDGSTLFIKPHSKVSLDRISSMNHHSMVDTHIRLYQGKVNTYVPPNKGVRFKVDTPSAVATVRGTEFRLNLSSSSDSNEDNASISRGDILRGEVLRGLVDFSAQGSMEPVKSGYGILAEKGKPLKKPIKLLEKPLLIKPKAISLTLPVEAQWKALSGAAQYRLQLFHQETQERVLNETVSVHSYSITQLPIGCYQLRLNAIDNQNFEGEYEKHQFCITDNVLTAPIMDDFYFLAKGKARKPLLNWSSQASVEHYLVEVSKDQNFHEVLDRFEVAGTSFELPKKLSHKTVYLRVAAVGKNEKGPYGRVVEWKGLKYDRFFTFVSSLALLIMML